MGTLVIPPGVIYQADDLEDYTEVLTNLQSNPTVSNIVPNEELLKITFDFSE